MNKRLTITICSLLLAICGQAQDYKEPLTFEEIERLTMESGRATKPMTRWWWLGSAVDSAGIAYNMQEFAHAGIGGVEITPIYGVQGNEANDIPFLSERWMLMIRYCEALGDSLDIEVGMATGTGWPFGGPNVTQQEAACKALFIQDNNNEWFVVAGNTGQKVKRAAPGGEGFVIDHFDSTAVAHYLEGFDKAFDSTGTPRPHTFFNDSYEVYSADWTPTLPDEFSKRRGYDLNDHLYCLTTPDSLRGDKEKRVMSDYRETLGEMLLNNFTRQWTDWAHAHGAITRNQAHGSPANLIDIYGAVDIPECEGFGLTDFGIKGLRTDPGFTKKNDSDRSMMKYASSAAHITGKRFTSSETFTWLTEHFRTSLSQCKPDLDLLFLSGVNHVVFHGCCYSPKDEEWPGWRFYASVDMSPNNPWWEAMPAFSTYIRRCQNYLQTGVPDTDFLVYLPYYDMIYDQSGTVALFDIHSMARRAPKFINAINAIMDEGYDVDYVSDQYLQGATTHKAHSIKLKDSQPYAAVIIPEVRFMPLETLQKLAELADAGCKVVFIGDMPESVPGMGRISAGEQTAFEQIMQASHPFIVAKTYEEALSQCGGKQEKMVKEGLRYIRRRNIDGYHYFVSNLQDKDIDEWVELGVPFDFQQEDVILTDPMTGKEGDAQTKEGKKVRIKLASGESLIIEVTPGVLRFDDHYPFYMTIADTIPLTDWTLTFPKAAPKAIADTYTMAEAKCWTDLGNPDLNTTMATGCYATTVKVKKAKKDRQTHYVLDLGDVREWARVVVNGQEAATVFAVPFRCDITDYLRNGKNRLEIYVTNLPANRIAEMDRQGVPWRKFKEINVVDLNYKKDTYAKWETVPSGLNNNPQLLMMK